MKVASQNFQKLGQKNFGSIIEFENWMRIFLDQQVVKSILDSLGEGSILEKMSPKTKNIFLSKSSLFSNLVKASLELVLNCLVSIYSQIWDIVFDCYIIYCLIFQDNSVNTFWEHLGSGTLNFDIARAIASFIYLPSLLNLLEYLPDIFIRSFWPVKTIFILSLPFLPATVLFYKFVQNMERNLSCFFIDKTLAEVAAQPAKEVHLHLSNVSEGLESKRMKMKTIQKLLTRMKRTEAVLEGETQSVVKILLLLLTASSTAVHRGGIEVEFGLSDSLIPGISNQTFFIITIALRLIKNAVSYQRLLSGSNRSRDLSLQGSTILWSDKQRDP